MASTIRDVARHSQVSISTASRALNGRSDVSRDVRARVLAAARELNYTANLHARALKGATTKTLGVVLFDSNSFSFNAPLLQGIYEAATPRGYGVIVCDTGGQAAAERQAHQMLVERRVDGLLINSTSGGAEPLRRLEAAGVPYVLLNRRMDELDCDYVVLDYPRGSYLVARHLLAQGHRRLLYQLVAPDHAPSQERLPGYRRALDEAGVPFDPRLVVYGQGMAMAHAAVLEAMVALQPRPTAVMAYNDESALPVLKALRDLHLRVPDDVAVTGQNDLRQAQYLDPPLTTVAHSAREVGRQGAEILFEKLRLEAGAPWTPRRIAFEPRLIVRESSAHRLDAVAAAPATAAEPVAESAALALVAAT